MKEHLEQQLESGPLLFDGAMGSLLISAGLTSGESPELWNVERPRVLTGIHRAYYEAGARFATANTFGGSRIKLEAKGLGGRVEELNRAGVELALGARPAGGYVAGDMGPTGLITGLPETARYDRIEEAFTEQAAVLASAGADLIIVETMYDLEEAQAALRAAERTLLPVVVSMTFQKKPRGFFTLMGNEAGECAAALGEAGAWAVGANCTLDPADMLELVGIMRRATSLPLIVQPNAGQPALEHGRPVYSIGPAVFALGLRRLMEEGAAVLGGCCGTTPEHIRAVRSEIDEHLAHSKQLPS